MSLMKRQDITNNRKNYFCICVIAWVVFPVVCISAPSPYPKDQPTAVATEESVIVTNRKPDGDRTWSKELYQFPIKNRIYDIGIMAYSKWFADRYGYPYEYVSDELGSDGLHFVEFQFYSHKGRVRYMLNFAIVPDDELDLPTHNFVQGTSSKPNMPKKRNDYNVPEDLKYTGDRHPLLTYYSKYGMNIHLSNKSYGPGKRRVADSSGLMGFQNYVFKGLDFITINIVGGDKPLKQKDPSIWIRKKGKEMRDDSLKNKRDYFKIYQLPVELANKAGNLMRPSGRNERYNVRGSGDGEFETLDGAKRGAWAGMELFKYQTYHWEGSKWMMKEQVINNKENYFKRVEALKEKGKFESAKKSKARWEKYSKKNKEENK